MHMLISRARRMYRGLPYPVRGVAASAFGLYLRWWRYAPDTERLVDEALERDEWTQASWAKYQTARLAEVLDRAATRVPYYREAWRKRRVSGDHRSWEVLDHWPILTKDEVRTNPRAFVADDVSASRLFRVSTSGTSGSPLTMWRSRRASVAWYALFEARTRRWYGVDRSVPWALLGGQVVVPPEREVPPFWVWNRPLRQLYLSSLHLKLQNVAAYRDALERHGIEYLYGYASSMAWLARLSLEADVRMPPMRVAISNAEPMSSQQRTVIEAAFGCAVRDTYGMVESVAAASECEHGTMHMWPDAGIVELLDAAAAHGAVEGSHRMICTGLLNDAMPLVRYDVGDRAVIAASSTDSCPCGRHLPRMVRVEGRSSDNLVTRDGRLVFWLNPVFYELDVREAQIVQPSIDQVIVNLVPGDTLRLEDDAVIAERLHERLGDIDVQVRRVESISRGPNGKFRPVVNLVGHDEDAVWDDAPTAGIR